MGKRRKEDTGRRREGRERVRNIGRGDKGRGYGERETEGGRWRERHTERE